jgi:hypothetical protein
MRTMRRIDEARNKTISSAKSIKILGKDRLQVNLGNGQHIILCAKPMNYGYEAGIYIEKDTFQGRKIQSELPRDYREV